MEKLIEALNIFLKYGNDKCPTCCVHDVLIVSIDPSLVSEEDCETLRTLSFYPDSDGEYGGEGFYSFKYGSC